MFEKKYNEKSSANFVSPEEDGHGYNVQKFKILIGFTDENILQTFSLLSWMSKLPRTEYVHHGINTIIVSKREACKECCHFANKWVYKYTYTLYNIHTLILKASTL
jgi:hypothetical protein